jgi:AraC family transcriptional regulator of adaptative response / DNA-3-methyladenine glycosylase II
MTFDIANHEACYRASARRDARFDGRFYTAVTTTGIYCRPICPAPAAKREHCRFFQSAAAADAAGFRPCIRCRPELAPGSAGWDGSDRYVRRAMAFIADGGLSDGRTVSELARYTGVGARHLRRLFLEHVGASPVEVASAHRIALAKMLLADTSLSITDVALASGFRSLRRFNDVFKGRFGEPPSQLRRSAFGTGTDASTIRLHLPYRRPFDWQGLLGFFARHALPQMEVVTRKEYWRTFRLGKAVGRARLSNDAGRSCVLAQVQIDRVGDLPSLVGRLRHLIDADCDPDALLDDLGVDPWIGSLLRQRRGLRIPGAIDPFEQAVRAIIERKLGTAAARAFAERIVARWGSDLPVLAGPPLHGGPTRLFPTAQTLGSATLEDAGLPLACARTIRALAQAVTLDPALLSVLRPVAAAHDGLRSIPGIDHSTLDSIALQALGDPDAFPSGDARLLAAARRRVPGATSKTLAELSDSWRPWRGYATILLWADLDDGRSVS